MKKILIALTLGGLLCVPLARAEDGKATLTITGMTCHQCAAGVKKSLTKLDGVKAADVSLDKGQAAVTFDPARVTTDKLIAAVGKAGGSRHSFEAELAEPRNTVTLKVAGMTCAGCAKNVEGALKKMEGVKTVQVDLDTAKRSSRVTLPN